LIAELFNAASVMQIPHRLIDFMEEKQNQAQPSSVARESA